jgi:hypothetical protein
MIQQSPACPRDDARSVVMLLPNGGEPRGLYLDMPPWQSSIFALTRKGEACPR